MSVLTLLPLLLLSLLPHALCIDSGDYGRTFRGDGTYYGFTNDGNCAIRPPVPDMYDGMLPVAINNAQYAGSLACGACIEVTGTGGGSGANPILGTFKAWVSDRCPECVHGDLDLSKSGDGRWDITWKFVECEGEMISFQFEGSNMYYLKLQPRGTKVPVKKLSVDGINGVRQMDNHFEVRNGGGFRFPATVKMVDIDDKEIIVSLEYLPSGGKGIVRTDISGARGGRGPGGPSTRPPTTRRPTTRRPPTRPTTGRKRCVPKYKACTGPLNRWGSSRCCSKKFRCKSKRGVSGKRCQPKRRKCVPNWKACTGRRNTYGTSRCCGNFKCARARKRGFVGKRCVPKSRRR